MKTTLPIIAGSVILVAFLKLGKTEDNKDPAATAQAAATPAPTPTPAVAMTALERARHDAIELKKGLEDSEYKMQLDPEVPYPPIAEWNEASINIAVTWIEERRDLKGENFDPFIAGAVISNLQIEFDKQVPKKDKKTALLWALNYVEGLQKLVATRGLDTMNVNRSSVRKDVARGADYYYPEDDLMNRWFIRYTLVSVYELTREARRIVQENTLPEQGLKEVRAARKEWREEINTSEEYNEVRKAIAAEKPKEEKTARK